LKTNLKSLLNIFDDFKDEPALAVAVSGGADSLALVFLLSQWSKKTRVPILALTVDHGLRAQSKIEARMVQEIVEHWPNVSHQTLSWRGPKPTSRIQETAREKRYELLAKSCLKADIRFLFLGHHQDDQFETILFRLAKGSGLDGLGGMQDRQAYSEKLTLVRPLLHLSHRQIVQICQKNKIKWIEDPSNDATRFARIRLRKSREILEAEGLSAERLLQTSKRLMRARKALEQITEEAWKNHACIINSRRIEFSFRMFQSCPEEISLRLLSKSIRAVTGPKKTYPPRLEKLETIHQQILSDINFKAATLGGAVIQVKRVGQGREKHLIIQKEA
jgi:tRNA(Ile)-lysidine synthase